MSEERRSKLATLHGLARAQGLDEDAYRDKLQLITGARSARHLDEAALDRAIASFHVKQKANNPYTAKVKALWIACWNLGALENGDDAALDAFVRRQTGKERLSFVTPGEANSVTEALKVIAARHGFDVPANDPGGIEARRALIRAQWKRLAGLGQVRDNVDAMEGYLSKAYLSFRGSLINLKRHQLDAAARKFGAWIRRTKKADA